MAQFNLERGADRFFFVKFGTSKNFRIFRKPKIIFVTDFCLFSNGKRQQFLRPFLDLEKFQDICVCLRAHVCARVCVSMYVCALVRVCV